MFKRLMQSLKGEIEFFVFHGREVIVLEILWREIKHRHSKATTEQRRERLIAMINTIAEDQK